ncbi:MAG: ATP-dependent helicase HrpB [Isosphaeraceae bacterium]
MNPLPIDSVLTECLEALRGGSLVVAAPPGSGKTTRLPAAIVESNLLGELHPAVVTLQPRRVAARAAARRVADERGWTLGREVGYQVRFERRFVESTRLRFVTEGILTRQLLGDPFLEGIGAVVLDEFHERSLDTDLALALLREVRDEVRPDLKIVVMSATLDAGPVAEFLGGCPIVRAEGRLHSVSISYRPADSPTRPETLVPIVREWLDDPREAGHLLVFLPGMGEIRRAVRAIEPIAEAAGALVLPLHGSLPAEDQDRALQPTDRRKIILSTNVAETSLTIEGVRTVIDTGLARLVRFDPERGVDRWSLERISRASAEQRAGRAGRTAPGRCIRLWSERDERAFPAFQEPEIRRVDLAGTLLSLHSWGQNEPARFRWFEPPDTERLASAERVLAAIGAVDGVPPRITPLGRRILDLPVHPRLARLLLAAVDAGRTAEGAAVAALLSEKDIRTRSVPEFGRPNESRPATTASSDVLVRLDELAEAEAARFSPSLRSRGIDPSAARAVAQLRSELLQRIGRDRGRGASGRHDDDDEIRRWLLLAYPDRVVRRRGADGTGVMVGGRGVRLDPRSVVRDAELYLALDAREDRRGGRREVHAAMASAIAPAWLEELRPGVLRRESATVFDPARGRVIGLLRVFYEDLLLGEAVIPVSDPEATARLLAEAVRDLEPNPVRDDPCVGEWLARLDLVRRAMPELSWPADETLIARLLEQACHGKTSVDQIERSSLVPLLESQLDRNQARELREGAPDALVLPGGRRARLAYEAGRPPVLAARLQDLFGWKETPRLARGRVPVLLHILGPNHRPVQVTDDLHSFWTTTYFQVRKDLRGRYPKHRWPDAPLEAEPQPPGRPRSG